MVSRVNRHVLPAGESQLDAESLRVPLPGTFQGDLDVLRWASRRKSEFGPRAAIPLLNAGFDEQTVCVGAPLAAAREDV